MIDVVFEFSRPVDVAKIPPRGMDIEITAKPEECAALAKRMNLIDLSAFTAKFELRHIDGGTVIDVNGSLSAKVTQQCVVTLEPIPVAVADTIQALFAPPEMVPADPGTTEIMDVFAIDPEPITDGVIDLGELASQHLALALDPYPRKPGVELPSIVAASNQNVRENPFARLKDLIKTDKE